eukprot:augustus_masked-scaffold_39-processed-gene-2.85-mRNA-1 protein AED:1.00 eAED:1.00 QI:0/0/0/0/1/1/2/0/339
MDKDPEIRTPLGKREDISTFESLRTLPGLLEEGRAPPTGQGKRQRGEDPKNTVFLLKKMQEQIDELLRDNQDLRTKLGTHSGIPNAASAGLFSSVSNVSSGLNKKDFKDGFGSRLSDTSKSFGNSMLYLATSNAMSAQSSEAREEKDKCELLKGAQVESWRGIVIKLFGLKKAVLLDTGTHFNAVSKDFFEKNFAALNLKIKEVSTTRHAGGGTLKVLGEVNLWIEIANQAACIPFRILNTLTVDVLLGMPICSEAVIDYVNKEFKFDGNKAVDIFKWEDRERYESLSTLENMEENYLLIVCNQLDTNKLKWEDTNKGADENYLETLLEELDIMKKEKK